MRKIQNDIDLNEKVFLLEAVDIIRSYEDRIVNKRSFYDELIEHRHALIRCGEAFPNDIVDIINVAAEEDRKIIADLDEEIAISFNIMLDRHLELLTKEYGCLPSGAERLLSLILPHKEHEEKIGDLEEVFQEQVAKHGLAFARRWYWAQAFWLVAASGLTLVERLAKLFKRSG